MHTEKSNFKYFIAGLLIFISASYILYPYFQYYVDPDATSYFTIVNRYLTGDTHNAVNAYWSPLGIWLTVICIKWTAWPPFFAAFFVNGLACIATLWTSQVLFHKFRTLPWEKWCFAIFFALFWAFANFKQNFTDIWQYFFLLMIIIIMLKKEFLLNPALWITVGLLAALAFFAKAYSFYFIPLFLGLFLALKWGITKQLNFRSALIILSSVLIVCLSAALPWIIILYGKYGIITTSTAGALNLSWFLVGEPIYHPEIKALIPPSVPGGIFLFEDPLVNQASFPKWYHSVPLFFKQVLRVTYNYIGWTESSNLLSSFYFITWIAGLVYFLNLNRLKQSGPISVIWIFFTIYPLAFWMLSFDSGRYLWVTLPMMCILCLFFLDNSLFPLVRRRGRYVLTLVLFLSLIIQPLRDIKQLAHQGKQEYELAEQLKELNISGSFISNYGYNTDWDHFILRVAFFSGNPWYCHVKNNWTDLELIEDAKRYDVSYYFYFYNSTASGFELRNHQGTPYPEISGNKIKGLKVFKIN